MVRGLSSQGWKASRSEYQGCAFYGIHGRRCAVGWLIRDDVDRDQVHEGGLSVPGEETNDPLTLGQIDCRKNLRGFLLECQTAHDDAGFPSGMLKNFLALSKKHGLKWPRGVRKALAK